MMVCGAQMLGILLNGPTKEMPVADMLMYCVQNAHRHKCLINCFLKGLFW